MLLLQAGNFLVLMAGSVKVIMIPISFQDRLCGNAKMNFSIVSNYLMQLDRLSPKGIFSQGPLLVSISILIGLLDGSLLHTLSPLDISTESVHFASFLLATHLGFLILPFVNDDMRYRLSVNEYIRFTTILLLAIFLREGILALPAMQMNTNPLIRIVFLVASTSFSWITAIFISRCEHLRPQVQRVDWKLFGTLLIGYTILLRLVYLGNIELIQEEAYYWNYAQHMAPGYLDHPPMIALLIQFGTLLFGNNEFGVRFAIFLCWFITAFYTYRLSESIFNRGTAFGALLLIAVLPVFFGVALVATPDAPLVACWSGALYYLYRALVQLRPQSWYRAGLFLGLGLASKYTIAFLGPAIILYMLMDSSARKWFLRPQPYLAALLALFVFSPVIWWNYQNDWASFLFQSQGRIQATIEFSTPELLGSILLLLTPTGFLAAISILRPRFARLYSQNSDNDTFRRSYIFGLTMVVIPLAIFTLFSITKEVKLNWTGPLWLSVIPFIAFTMVSHSSKGEWLVARLWPKTLVILVISYGVLLHYCAIGLPGIPYGKGDFLFGWEDFARQVEEEVQKIAEQQGERPLVAGIDKYKIASGLAFYRNKLRPETAVRSSIDETTSRQLFGYHGVMYNYWHPPSMATGRDILVISAKKHWLAAPVYQKRYQDLGTIHDFTVYKKGKVAGRYYYRLLTGYTPDGKG